MDASEASTQAAQISIVWWGGAILVFIGVLKCAFYFVASRIPDRIDRIQSPTLKKFLLGRSNRLIFGWGGFITAVVGLFFMGAARLMTYFAERYGF